MFPDDTGTFLATAYYYWTDEQLKNISFYLIEFVAKYRNQRTGQDISPSTFKKYIFGIQRGLNSLWNYDVKLLTGLVSIFPKEEIFAVVDNKAREQHIIGNHVVNNNFLSR